MQQRRSMVGDCAWKTVLMKSQRFPALNRLLSQSLDFGMRTAQRFWKIMPPIGSPLIL